MQHLVSSTPGHKQKLMRKFGDFFAPMVQCSLTGPEGVGFADPKPVPATTCFGEMFVGESGTMTSNLAFVNFAVDTDSAGSVFMIGTTGDLSSVSPDGEALPGSTKKGCSTIMLIAFDEQGIIAAFHQFPDTLITSQVQMRSLEFAQGVSLASSGASMSLASPRSM